MSKKKTKNGYVLYVLSKPYSCWGRSYNVEFKWYGTLYTRERLVTECAKSLGKDYSILDNLSKDMKETSTPYDYKRWDYEKLYFITRLIGNEEYYVNIDSLRKEAEKRAEKGFKTHYYWRLRYASADTYHPVFRRDPIPHVGKNKAGGRGYDAHSGIKRYVQDNTDPEYREFSKPKHSNPYHIDRFDWDDVPYCGNHNWKKQYKVRHQWEIHKKKHKDTVTYIDKRLISLKEEKKVLSEMREP